MHSFFQIYVILLAAGLFLVGAEIFLPGGIIGVLGGFALLGAIIMGFFAFGTQGGLLSALAIVLLSALAIVVWIRFFPRTRVGRSLTLSQDGSQFKAAPSALKDLVGKEGVTLTILRPAGMARIEGRRVDVVADGSWIDEGRTVRVTEVDGTRVIVRDIAPPAPSQEKRP